MTIFLQATAGVVLAVIVFTTLGKRSGEIATALSIAVCCMVLLLAVDYLRPIAVFVTTLQQLGNLDGQMITILLKVVGISLISQIACLFCADSGNASMGKALQMLTVVVILYLSLPVLQTLLELVEEIMGRVS